MGFSLLHCQLLLGCSCCQQVLSRFDSASRFAYWSNGTCKFSAFILFDANEPSLCCLILWFLIQKSVLLAMFKIPIFANRL